MTLNWELTSLKASFRYERYWSDVEIRRILLDGYPTDVVLDGETLIARDGRRVEAASAVH